MKIIEGTEFTHKGWFYLCPIYLSPDCEKMMPVIARHPVFDGWFKLNEAMYKLFSIQMVLMNPYCQFKPVFRVTGLAE